MKKLILVFLSVVTMSSLHALSHFQQLLTACDKGNLFTVKDLVQIYKVDVNQANQDGITPLMQACISSRFYVARYLIERGAEVNTVDVAGMTPLLHAARLRTAKIVELLLQHNANVHVENIYQMTPLLYACQEGQKDSTLLLLDHGADINHGDEYGQTALMIAAENKQYEIVQLLLFYNADINKQDEVGWSALTFALSSYDLSIFNLLLENGADPFVKSTKGTDVLDLILHSQSNYLKGSEKWQLYEEAELTLRLYQDLDMRLVHETLQGRIFLKAYEHYLDKDGSLLIYLLQGALESNRALLCKYKSYFRRSDHLVKLITHSYPAGKQKFNLRAAVKQCA